MVNKRMARLPLADDTLFEGVIYRQGETQYPESLEKALEEKAQSVARVSADPIFKAPQVAEPVQSPEGQALTLSVPQPPVPPPPPVASEIPDDLPQRQRVVEYGITSLEELRELPDLKVIPGIGPANEQEIRTYLEGLDQTTQDGENDENDDQQ